jgi:twitching motility protein PilT
MHSATCAESLSRICMAFSPDIQSSIRAQLADCLVGVVCQRLEFLEHHQLRVPRCEMLLASTGAKGAIRAGQFSQLANVIQTGGEDGMWTFDRYERWMEQRRDWSRPPAPVAVAGEPIASQHLFAPTRGPTAPSPKSPLKASRPIAAPVAGENGPIEIAIDEDADLTELAKRVEQRTP